ncbi:MULTISPECIES: phospholipase [unclassified Rhizobium]|nr:MULTISPECIES: phospholipase [unclassified Rhizobium]MBB3404704.1 putative esterase [Rhizobium sp. BK289]MBB3416924.1 putative esterase [Rhizobium sp. BK284]MBB3484801.1 putative esterase [Rhizobium sp. BK347]
MHHEPLLLGATPEEAQVHCVFIHGRTQSPEDMHEQVIGRLKAWGVAFVLPRAAGRSWYGARATERLTPATREELEGSLAYIRGIADELTRRRHATPLLIGGFSQGACLALEYAMKYGPWRGAMVNLTGCRVGTTECDRPFADLDRMPVYLTGSDKDPWIPVDAFADAAESLARARASLRCDVVPDRAHEVSAQEIGEFENMLSQIAGGDRVIL